MISGGEDLTSLGIDYACVRNHIEDYEIVKIADRLAILGCHFFWIDMVIAYNERSKFLSKTKALKMKHVESI